LFSSALQGVAWLLVCSDEVVPSLRTELAQLVTDLVQVLGELLVAVPDAEAIQVGF
jgi:hypothetical protein